MSEWIWPVLVTYYLIGGAVACMLVLSELGRLVRELPTMAPALRPPWTAIALTTVAAMLFVMTAWPFEVARKWRLRRRGVR